MQLYCRDKTPLSTELTDLDLLESCSSQAEIEAETIAAYDLLALEYDSATHATTRALEQLSLHAFDRIINSTSVISNAKRVLEVGCGTGVLSTLLLHSLGEDKGVVLLDASARMLKQARTRLKNVSSRKEVRYLHASILSSMSHTSSGVFDVIICGLGDPYFVDRAVSNIGQYCSHSAFLVVTLPERSWAETERIQRLKIPINRTRFRLSSGLTVYPFSFTYSENELCELMLNSGFETQIIWSESLTSQAEHEGDPRLRPPTIVCALARKMNKHTFGYRLGESSEPRSNG